MMNKTIYVDFKTRSITKIDEVKPRKVTSRGALSVVPDHDNVSHLSSSSMFDSYLSRREYLGSYKHKKKNIYAVNNIKETEGDLLECQLITDVLLHLEKLDQFLTAKRYFDVGIFRQKEFVGKGTKVCLGLIGIKEKVSEMSDTLRVMLSVEANIQISPGRDEVVVDDEPS